MAAPKPRLCHLKKKPDFAGYGFNLHARQGFASQFIGKIDPDSPAEQAGLLKGDRVVEVNGDNVEQASHAEVVAKIKERAGEVILLVVDQEADDYYKERNVPITESLITEPLSKLAEEIRNRQDSDSSSSSDDSHRVVVVVQASANQNGNGLAPKPRLCILRKVPQFSGYGFNLQAKPNQGHFIGKVDTGSPAQAADLREGDRLIEVNDVNVEKATHAEAVTLIKQRSDEVVLLVADETTFLYYRERGIPITNALLQDTPFTAARSSEQEVPAPSNGHEYSIISDVKPAKTTGPKPRLCVITRVPTFSGYGFNLHSEKGRSGQYIGKVDSRSPAEFAGLRENDKVVEVNGTNVENQSHHEVVTKIKEFPNEVTILVADQLTEAYYRDRNIPITRELAESGNEVYAREGPQTTVSEVAYRKTEPAPIAASQPNQQRGSSADILTVTQAQVRERLQQKNPRVRVKQDDKSFKEKSNAFDML